MRSPNPFSPGFGFPPEIFFGRRAYLDRFIQALSDPHDPQRVVFLEGLRGSGKTVLLHRMAQIARQRSWAAYETHSNNAAAELLEDLLPSATTKRFRASLSPTVTLPDGTSLGLGEMSREALSLSPKPSLTRALIAQASSARQNGVFIAIDEAQKLSEQDAVEICVAVQSARMRGLPLLLVMAGLPGTKAKVSHYPGCTFMQRAPRIILELLTKQETLEALQKSFALVPEISLQEEQIQAMARFTYGHPYLLQLVGFHTYRIVDSLFGTSLEGGVESVAPGVGELAMAEQLAYETYRDDVVKPVIDPLGKGTKAYLQELIATLDDQGRMTNGKAIAQDLGKTSAKAVAPYRQRLIDRLILKSAGWGLVRFRLPYITRYFEELDAAASSEDEGDDDWVILQ